MTRNVRLTLDRDDELGDNGEDLSLAVLEEVEDTLAGEEAVGLLLLADTLHEDGEVVMVVELLGLNLPLNHVGRAVLDLDGKISTVVEAAELGRRDGTLLDSASSGSNFLRLLNGLVEGGDLATRALALLRVSLSGVAGGNTSLSSGEDGRVGDSALFAGEMSLGEVAKDGMLRPGEQLVVSHVECLLTSLGEELLQVVFDGETARNGCSLAHSLSQHS